MAYEEMRVPAGEHRIVLEDREQLTISGVEEVESFDENSILLTTAQGGLEIQGEGLHIEKLSLDGGDLKVEGLVSALIYQSESRERGGLLSRLLGGLPSMWRPRDWPCVRPWGLGRPWACSMICSGYCGCGCAESCWSRCWTCCSGWWWGRHCFSGPSRPGAGRCGPTVRCSVCWAGRRISGCSARFSCGWATGWPI